MYNEIQTKKINVSFKPLNKISQKMHCKYKMMLLFEIKKKSYVN